MDASFRWHDEQELNPAVLRNNKRKNDRKNMEQTAIIDTTLPTH